MFFIFPVLQWKGFFFVWDGCFFSVGWFFCINTSRFGFKQYSPHPYFTPMIQLWSSFSNWFSSSSGNSTGSPETWQYFRSQTPFSVTKKENKVENYRVVSETLSIDVNKLSTSKISRKAWIKQIKKWTGGIWALMWRSKKDI